MDGEEQQKPEEMGGGESYSRHSRSIGNRQRQAVLEIQADRVVKAV